MSEESPLERHERALDLLAAHAYGAANAKVRPNLVILSAVVQLLNLGAVVAERAVTQWCADHPGEDVPGEIAGLAEFVRMIRQQDQSAAAREAQTLARFLEDRPDHPPSEGG